MAFDTRDTIVAIATPPGRGGIGVVRVSGPEAHAIARALITHTADLQPRHATLTTVRLTPDTTQEMPTSETSAEVPATQTSTTDSKAPATTAVVSGFGRTANDL